MKNVLLLVAMIYSAATVTASVRGVYVDYTVDGKDYQGYVVYNPNQEGVRPAVLIVPEWWGLNQYAKSRARDIAELGYIAFVADMYGKGIVTTKADEAGQYAGPFYQDRSKFVTMTTAALQQMLNQVLTDTTKTAAIGFCFGGSAVLELARSGADVKGVVSFHGNLSNPTPENAKNIKSRVLVLHGDADPFAPVEQVTGLEKEMKDADVNYKLVLYPGAKHAFTNPQADAMGIEGIAYDQNAEKASMEEMRAFFREIFADKKE